MLGIEDILEILATPLLGIIPESQDVLRASNVGSPVTLHNADSAPARAYIDAVNRLMGETIAMTVPTERKGFMSRLLGRRAA
jgi:septum site-determining protein MinD